MSEETKDQLVYFIAQRGVVAREISWILSMLPGAYKE
jgi:hypothetical protein